MAQLEISITTKSLVDSVTGSISYLLRTAVVNAIGGIDSAVFVMRIGENATDSYERVAGIVDLSEISRDRAAAENEGDEFYRISNVDIPIDDPSLIEAARIAIEDSVNSLLSDYNAFVGVDVNTSQKVYSGVDRTFLENLTAGYNQTVQEVADIEKEIQEKQAIIDALNTSLIEQRDRVSNLKIMRQSILSPINTFYRNEIVAWDTVIASYSTILGFSSLTGGEISQVNSFQNTASSYKSIVTNAQATTEGTVPGLDQIITDEISLQETKFQEVNDAIQAVEALVKQKEERVAAQARALSAILELDPDFVST